MSTRVTYVQCTLKRRTREGIWTTTSYLPKQFAMLDRVLKLKDEQEQWVDGWVVDHVGFEADDREHAPDYRKAIRNHRQNTGDALS